MQYKINKSNLKELLNIEQYTDNQLEEYIRNNYEGIDKLSITEDEIIIEVSDKNTPNNQFRRLVHLSENGKYQEAIKLAEEILSESPSHSEVNRILGQIYFVQDKMELAEEYVLNALRWNPENQHALTLMGNLQYKAKDIQTALSYWNQALRYNSEDYLSLTNIGSLLCKEGHTKEGVNFLGEALKIKPDFPNALHSLALVHYNNDDFSKAFNTGIECAKANPEPNVQDQNNRLIKASALKCIEQNQEEIKAEVSKLKAELEYLSEKKILVKEVEELETPAKIRIAEYQNLSEHELMLKRNNNYTPHLAMHELYHLKLVIEARAENNNFLFVSDNGYKNRFHLNYDKQKKKLIKSGLTAEVVNTLFDKLFQGSNSHMYNTPIDLFIEDYIFKNHEVLRPLQYLSLLQLLEESIQANTDKQIVEIMPKKVISKSKILNLTNAKLYKDLYGINLEDRFQATLSEKQLANELYDEFIEYRLDRAPGEEYEILKHWSEDIGLSPYFELVPENKNDQKNVDEALAAMLEDPLGLEDLDSSQQRNMKKFLANHEDKNLNTSVVMYMLGALSYFEGKSKDKIKSIAFEFAKLGMAGIDPKKNNYSVPSIDKKMTGYQALAYYYVSWALAIPEHLAELQMPFEREYDVAYKMKNA